jgi:uroporphyrin-III C-methyltransferase/precorrin-2 dehydrogenase/sirohydrochlorin ferrochelatase
MDYLPIFVDLRDRRVLVVGGGEVAGRKVALLREAHASVTVVAPEISNEIRNHDGVTWTAPRSSSPPRATAASITPCPPPRSLAACW